MSTDIDVKARSVLQIGALVQSGMVDPEHVAELTLSAIDASGDPAIFTRLTAERARTEAREASQRVRAGRPRSLLEGVPIAWKDLFDLEGIVTTAGSKVLADAPAARADAAVVARLKAAGMVTVGRVNMTEFAFSGLGLNPHFGTPLNPNVRDVPRIPGGSSSGSGAAVAAGIVPVSIGTDTGGSVRIPAAFNGIVGYKATRGRYPMDGVFPLATSLDSLGVLCRTVEDAVLVDAAMCGRVGPSVQRGRIEGATLVVPTNVVFDNAEPGVIAAFEAALSRLEAAGATVIRRAIPAFDEIASLAARHGALVTAEAYALHAARLSGPEAGAMDRRVVARARLGSEITMPDYVALLTARARLIATVRDELGDALVAYPTVAHVAPPIEPLEKDDDHFVRVNGLTLRNTALGNFLDWCGVSLPCGTGDAGMPVGLLLSGMPNADERLLSLALAAEAVVREPGT